MHYFTISHYAPAVQRYSSVRCFVFLNVLFSLLHFRVTLKSFKPSYTCRQVRSFTIEKKGHSTWPNAICNSAVTGIRYLHTFINCSACQYTTLEQRRDKKILQTTRLKVIHKREQNENRPVPSFFFPQRTKHEKPDDTADYAPGAKGLFCSTKVHSFWCVSHTRRRCRCRRAPKC